MTIKIVELTKDNEEQYLDQTADLEQKVLQNMESRGQIGQLFPTGKEDISLYAHSKENTVLLAVDEEGKVLATTYITQGQKPFTYNDITKYFKYGDQYQEYVKSRYKTVEEYRKDMLGVYKIKIEAFKYAKQKILEQFPNFDGDILKFLQHELEEDQNHFHEKSPLRELLNIYMSEYIKTRAEQIPGLEQRYEMFYWTTADDIFREFGKNGKVQDKDETQLNQILHMEKEDIEYSKILQKGGLQIYEEPKFDVEKYYSANTSNSIELDTYLTDPDSRRSGLARILVMAGIEKHMKEHFEQSDDDEIFLCSTLHRDNLSSKYVSEFFGLKDSLYVKRRDGRNRQVHICKVEREDYKKYLDHMKKRIAILYGYNPQKLTISKKEEVEILREQLEYENAELLRIQNIREQKGRKFTGAIDYGKNKANKVYTLKQRLQSAIREEKEEQKEMRG